MSFSNSKIIGLASCFLLLFGGSAAPVFSQNGGGINPTEIRQGKPQQLILPKTPGVALSNLALFPDSSLTAQTTEMVKEGDLVEVVGTSILEHEDKDQNQKFHWFQVKTLDGKTGWLFGDGLAVGLPDERISADMASFSRKNIALNAGFEQTTMWLAALEGRDNQHEEDHLNPIYDEQYLVLSNPRGRSVAMRIGGAGSAGRTDLKSLQTLDLTGDGAAEFLVETASFEPGSPLEQRDLEIFSLQTGSLSKIFEERLTLTTDKNDPSPALFKSIEPDGKTIRREFIDFVSKEKYRLNQPLDWQNATREFALEFVTSTLEWSAKNRRFEPLYEETRIVPTGSVSQAVRLKTRPDPFAQASLLVQPGDKLLIIKVLEQFVVIDGQKKMRPWLFVKTASGVSGYVDATLIRFQKTRHARVLELYFQKAPLVISEWFFDFPFLKIAPKKSLE